MKLIETKYTGFVYNILKSSDVHHKEWTTIDYKNRLVRPFTKLYFINDKQGIIFLHISNEIGFYIKPVYQNKGLAKEALTEIIHQNPRNYYWSTARNDNYASKRLLEKIGFTPNGIVYSLNSKDILK